MFFSVSINIVPSKPFFKWGLQNVWTRFLPKFGIQETLHRFENVGTSFSHPPLRPNTTFNIFQTDFDSVPLCIVTANSFFPDRKRLKVVLALRTLTSSLTARKKKNVLDIIYEAFQIIKRHFDFFFFLRESTLWISFGSSCCIRFSIWSFTLVLKSSTEFKSS